MMPRMFRSGMPVDDMAKERRLATSTVYNHLTYFVGNGVLPLSLFVSGHKLDVIKRAVERVGTGKGIRAIKDECAPDVSFSDINMVIASGERLPLPPFSTFFSRIPPPMWSVAFPSACTCPAGTVKLDSVPLISIAPVFAAGKP